MYNKNSLKDKIYSLEGKIALITGGATGIGKGIAGEFIQSGAIVVVTGRTLSNLENVKKELGKSCHVFVNDITKKSELYSLINSIEEKVGPIDILVNNAGIHSKKPSIETTDGEFEEILDTNLKSLFALTRETLKRMIPRGRGSIINISSMSALYGISNVAAYSSSKAALSGLTRTLAVEYSHTGIRINAIAPGFIQSDMLRKAMDKDPARKDKVLNRTPMRRFGTPEDVGRAAAFLASEAAGC